MKKELIEFPVSIYGNLERVNDVLSRARVRIFYKYGNRNGTYITDEFAEELISTLPGVPVKGIFDGNDYTDHGENRSDGQVYGFVPESNQFAWEKHIDVDGIEREYACCDVYLFTALYSEASSIVGKSQSMELFEPTLTYHFAVINGLRYVVFEHGSFLGLQVLGDKVEPCFEGASFFSLQQQIQDTIEKIKQFSKGAEKMDKINFKLSDDDKYRALMALMNTNVDEDGYIIVEHAICSVYDDYAVSYNYSTHEYERVYYTKSDENDSVVIDKVVKCYIVDVTEEEKAILDKLYSLNGNTYELVNENLENAENNATKCAEFSTKIDELNNTITTLNTEIDSKNTELTDAASQYEAAKTEVESLSQKVQELETYRLGIEKQQKQAVISEYANKLSEELLNSYTEKMDEYTVEDLDMHLAYALKTELLSSAGKEAQVQYIPKDVPGDSVNEILARYKR